MIDKLFLVGLGNIGTQVVPLLAKLPDIECVHLIDFDRYETANLGTQRLAPGDVGRPKAKVQARLLRFLEPPLEVRAHASPFENLPLGLLRDGVILSCVDSRRTRQAINRAAVALGVPWIDAALAREGSVRARVHLPGHACLECGWGPRDYELLEQRQLCLGARSAAAATNAPAELGAIAAGLQVALLRRLLTEANAADALADRQWFFDLPSGRAWIAGYDTNPECPLDHARWEVTPLGRGSAGMSLRDALGRASSRAADAALAVPGMTFVRRLRCPRCGVQRRFRSRLSGRIGAPVCAACAVPLLAAALDVAAELSSSDASNAVLREPLARRGLVAGDVVAVTAGGMTRHFQLA